MRVRAVTLALLVAASVFVTVGAAAPAAPGDLTATPANAGPSNDGSAGSANNSSMGSQVSSFMESSAGETDASVDGGMWAASFDAANNSSKAQAIQQRTEALRSQLATLRERKRTLLEARNNGSIGQSEFQVRMSNLVGRMAALNRSIGQLAVRANATGANMSAVSELRRTARNVSGGEVAAVARSLAGGPPDGLPAAANRSGGPPGQDGPPGQGNGNQSAGPGEGNGNQSAGPGQGNGNQSAGPGQGNEGGAKNGSDGQRGTGNSSSGNSGQGNSGNGIQEGGVETRADLYSR